MFSARSPRRSNIVATVPGFIVLAIISLSPADGFAFLNSWKTASDGRAYPLAHASLVGTTRHAGTRRVSLNSPTTLAASPDADPAASASCGDVFILSYDGAVADTAETNALLAIDTALSIWPELIRLYVGLDDVGGVDSEMPDEGAGAGDDEIESEQEQCDSDGSIGGGGGDWLLNKMVALSPAMGSDPDALMGCDAVLLARMLLEEQRLDSGRSVGCTGKYGSKFHPSSSASPTGDFKDEGRTDWRGNANGSRPLTVGEVRANWSTGALLRETARVRYNIDGRDPIPIIREEIEELRREESEYPTPVLNKGVAEILSSISSNGHDNGCTESNTVLICVGHNSHISTALDSLSQMNINARVVASTEDKALLGGGVVIVPPIHDRESQRQIVQRITEQVAVCSARGSTESRYADELLGRQSAPVYLIHSSSGVLNDCKRCLLGDDRPSFVDGFLRTPVQNGQVQLSLLLPSWAQNVDKQHCNDAEMDPWLGVLGEKDANKLMVGSRIEEDVIEAAPFS
mmetsp:Transcript_62135/g.183652  ORF Transcript_62135/g.183652 Transcript_62135/m.183652 type:complete len:517 (-) Transcript_62135:1027-2577(-)